MNRHFFTKWDHKIIFRFLFFLEKIFNMEEFKTKLLKIQNVQPSRDNYNTKTGVAILERPARLKWI